MELVNQLIENLGITEEQAKGGAALLLNMARGKLGEQQFARVAEFIPGIGEIMKATPQSGLLEKALETVTSVFGGGAEKVGGIASLAGGFSKLGLDADMIGGFIPVILSFVQSKGGESARSLLEGALK